MKNVGFLFDFDGTLTKPGSIDFPYARKVIGCPDQKGILEFIQELPEVKDRKLAFERLEKIEIEAAGVAQPNFGAEDLLSSLNQNGIPVGILSRNSYRSITTTLNNFHSVQLSDFRAIVSRDDRVKPKPSPEGVRFAAKLMNIQIQNLIFIGDFTFDVLAGQRAGATTIFLTNGKDLPEFDRPPDHVISHLNQVERIMPKVVDADENRAFARKKKT